MDMLDYRDAIAFKKNGILIYCQRSFVEMLSHLRISINIPIPSRPGVRGGEVRERAACSGVECPELR